MGQWQVPVAFPLHPHIEIETGALPLLVRSRLISMHSFFIGLKLLSSSSVPLTIPKICVYYRRDGISSTLYHL